MVCTSWMIFEIGKKPLKINPFHHDGVGGLKAFGQLSFIIFMLAMLICTLMVLILLFAPWKNGIIYHSALIAIIMYSVVIFSFFIPLLSIHKTLKNFKEEKLYAINDVLMTYPNEFLKCVNNNSNSKDIKDKLEGFLFVQSNINKMKTWPFGYTTIAKVLSGTFIPLISILIQAGIFTTIL